MMIITPRDILVLLALATYFILDRRHVQKLCFPRDPDGRVARRRLAALADAGLIRRHMTLVASSFDFVPAPVYLLTTKGREYLAKETGDSQYLFKPVDLPHPLHLIHAMAVAALHMTIDAAINAQTVVVMEAWFNEGDIVNAGEQNAAYYYKLTHQISRRAQIICSARRGISAKSETAGDLHITWNWNAGTGITELARDNWPNVNVPVMRRWHGRKFTRNISPLSGSTSSACCWSCPMPFVGMLFDWPSRRRMLLPFAPIFGGSWPLPT